MAKDAVVFVGSLPLDVKEWELIELFEKYGEIRNVDLKLPARPPGFAFIQFTDSRDARAAVEGKDGYDFCGSRIRVELSHGGLRSRTGGYYRNKGSKMFGVSKKTDYRVVVSGLPQSCSWQDLKDHMRKAGDVTYADVMSTRDGMIGLVDYATENDMLYAIDKLDDTEFENLFDRSYVRVREYTGQQIIADRGRSTRRSYTRSRSDSRSRSRSYRRSRDRSSSPRDHRRKSVSEDNRESARRGSSRSPTGRSSSRGKSFDSEDRQRKRGSDLSPSSSSRSGSFELKGQDSKSPSPKQ